MIDVTKTDPLKDPAEDGNPTPASESETPNEDQPAEDENPKPKEDEEIDYEAELKIERELRIKAEGKIVADKREKKKQKADPDLDFEDPDEDTPEPLTEERARQIAREENQAALDTQAHGLARSASVSDSHKNLILFHYNGSIVKTGNLEADMENAIALANKGRTKKVMEEIKRANQVRNNTTPDQGAGVRPLRDPSTEPELGPAQQKLKAERDLKWDSKRRGWLSGKTNRFYPEEQIGETFVS